MRRFVPYEGTVRMLLLAIQIVVARAWIVKRKADRVGCAHRAWRIKKRRTMGGNTAFRPQNHSGRKVAEHAIIRRGRR